MLENLAPIKKNSAPIFEWIVAVFAALVQQGAFVSIPLFIGNHTLLIREDQNATNTIAVAFSLISILYVTIRNSAVVLRIISQNSLSLLYVILIFASLLWSIHPDVSLRRGIGYVLTMLVAVFLSSRFDLNERMRVLSLSFAISAIGSILFIAIYPADGIMSIAELSGNWRGVFPHKNVLGPTMAVAVFVELFLISHQGTSATRLLLLALFVFLVAMSHSTTAFFLTAMYILGAAVLAIRNLSRLAAAVITIMVATIAMMIAISFYFDPVYFLDLLGKDSTLTGRTQIWANVLPLVSERPLLGYGYRAAWVLNDSSTIRVDNATGGWGVENSHNSFIELALQLGFIGLALILLIVLVGLFRAFRCSMLNSETLGIYALLFFGAILISGQTMETLGQNQVIEWLVFNVLLFSCGAVLHDLSPIERRVVL